ncbi:MAG TPA: TolC family protein [Vicinamibacterales bacterium]
MTISVTSSRTLLTLTILTLTTTLSARAQVPGQTRFLGGVPSGTATTETLGLSLTDAIQRALEHNLGVLMSEHAVEATRGARWRALSELLPNVDGRVGEARQTISLAAYGLTLPGIPSLVGPFNTFDARVFVTQSVFDLKAINDARAESHNVAAAEFGYKDTRDLVVLAAAQGYLQVLATSARADATRAQLDTAQALYTQAVDLRRNGLVAGIDVTRAEVQLSTERQRTTAAVNDLDKAKLRLARAIGLPIGQLFALSDELPYVPMPEITLEQALARALGTRADYQAAVERMRAAEAGRQAALGEALPSVHLDANYGALGLTAADASATFSVTGAVTVPIFQGGRTHGRLLEADAAIRSRRAEVEDLKAGIYYEVRTVFLDLQASTEQVAVATSGRALATSQLVQARDRFAAGVADNLEVVQAQEAVALASEQYITALYAFNTSKATLARTLGVSEEAIRQFLGGSR